MVGLWAILVLSRLALRNLSHFWANSGLSGFTPWMCFCCVLWDCDGEVVLESSSIFLNFGCYCLLYSWIFLPLVWGGCVYLYFFPGLELSTSCNASLHFFLLILLHFSLRFLLNKLKKSYDCHIVNLNLFDLDKYNNIIKYFFGVIQCISLIFSHPMKYWKVFRDN